MTDLREAIRGIDLEEWFDYAGVSYSRSSTDNVMVNACPACGRSGKVRFSKSRKLGCCFAASCQSNFNLFSFAKAYLGTDTPGTFQHLEAYLAATGIRIARKEEHRPRSPEPEDWALPDNVLLPTRAGETHPFLTNRGITLQTQALFDLRWCDEGSFAYTDTYGNAKRTDFSKRIILPVHDLDGHIKTFQGRATWDVDDEFEKRYLFPIGLPGSGRFLYGAHLVKGKEHVVMGEGSFDVMAIHQAICDHPDFNGVGAIGSFGLTIGHSDQEGDDQLARIRKLIKLGLRRMTILWDAEPGAWNAAITNGLMLRKEGLDVRLGVLPVGCDPNEVETRIVREAIARAHTLNKLSSVQLRTKPPFKA